MLNINAWSVAVFLVGTVSCLSTPHQDKYIHNLYTDQELFQSTFTSRHLEALRNETRNLFYHAWDSYMAHGFPFDEVNPITCQPNKRDFSDSSNTVKNDAMGNFSLTLFDNLDTFVVMRDHRGFEESIQLVRDTYTDFDIDSNVQVFETSIRVLGGLLSAHLYASDARRGFQVDGYDGFLLRLAYDLGKRLVLAFENDAGIPFPRTNLRHGPKKVPKKLQNEQCTAGVTSLVLEFSLLSRLTNDPIFEQVTRSTFLNIWASRTSLNLLPMSVDAKTNSFTDQVSGIGASIDSFYEYALKYSVLLDDEVMYDIWYESYRALLIHSQNSNGVFTNVHVTGGTSVTEWIDALGAFFPGLLVLAGDLTNVLDSYLIFFKLWNYYGIIPERWNYSGLRSEALLRGGAVYKSGQPIEGMSLEETDKVLLTNSIGLEWFPLRPEFIESTYHLYRATKDPFFLQVGESILHSYRNDFFAPCGFAGVADVRDGTKQGRMESFVLSESLKYLYLLFDEDNALHNINGAAIFSTEAHPFWFDSKLKTYNFSAEVPALEDLQRELEKDSVEEDSGIWGSLIAKLTGEAVRYDSGKYGELDYRFYKLKQRKKRPIDLVPVAATDAVTGILRDYGIKFPETGKHKDNEPPMFYVDRHTYQLVKPGILVPPIVPALEKYQLKLEADYLNLDRCQVLQDERLVPESLVLRYPKLYQDDYKYAISLRRPTNQLEKPELELEDKFYRHFGSSGDVSGLNCVRPHDTLHFEASIGSIDQVAGTQVYRIVPYKAGETFSNWLQGQGGTIGGTVTVPVLPGDYYVHGLENVRLTFEKLEEGRLDVFGDFVTEEFLGRYSGKNSTVSSVLRILKFNGVTLGSEEVVWTSYEWFTRSVKQGLGIWFDERGVAVINGEPVINLRLLG